MSALANLQRRLQAHVLNGDHEVLLDIEMNAIAAGEHRLRVYADAYRTRLIEALASNYPRLAQLLGETAFNAFALDYIASHPSTYRSIRWYGAECAQHLSATFERPWLAELARLEWAIAAAFDAADATSLNATTLANLWPDAWAELRFVTHPSVQILVCRTNAPAIFKSLNDEVAPPEPALLAQPQHWLVWRSGLESSYRSLRATEAEMVTLAMAGEPFAHLCEALGRSLAADDVPLEAAMLLKTWLNDGLISDIRTRA